jgi:hypothetical protein
MHSGSLEKPGASRAQAVTPHDVLSTARQAGFSVRSQSGCTVATITGELGGPSVPALREQLRGLADQQASRIIIGPAASVQATLQAQSTVRYAR